MSSCTRLGQAAKQKWPSSLFEHRIKKSQARNCDMCGELKRKCKSNWKIKVCKLGTARIIRTN